MKKKKSTLPYKEMGVVSMLWSKVFDDLTKGIHDVTRVKKSLGLMDKGLDCIGIKFRPDYGGVVISINRRYLEYFDSVLGANLNEVQRKSFSIEKSRSSIERGENLLQKKGLRFATLPEAIKYVVNRPDSRKFRLHGLIYTPFESIEGLNVSFEEFEGLVKICAARLNWQYLSNWRDPIPLLVVKL